MTGLGIDLVYIPEFIAQMNEPGTQLARAFHPRELRLATARAAATGREPAYHLAGRWAAKEAFIKAWSSEFFGEPPRLADPVDWAQVWVESDAWNRPRLVLEGELAAGVGNVTTHVSISHDGEYATAVVSLERKTHG
ncbi:holo-ACP synthase [Arcanobacterium wilhelmae]|nr:holo-ACP synthase [Arcanobacterium wilhelmae]WFN91126.1 holo-ACP synthase [Arcanobacterium wilhelmae]